MSDIPESVSRYMAKIGAKGGKKGKGVKKKRAKDHYQTLAGIHRKRKALKDQS